MTRTELAEIFELDPWASYLVEYWPSPRAYYRTGTLELCERLADTSRQAASWETFDQDGNLRTWQH